LLGFGSASRVNWTREHTTNGKLRPNFYWLLKTIINSTCLVQSTDHEKFPAGNTRMGKISRRMTSCC